MVLNNQPPASFPAEFIELILASGPLNGKIFTKGDFTLKWPRCSTSNLPELIVYAIRESWL